MILGLRGEGVRDGGDGGRGRRDSPPERRKSSVQLRVDHLLYPLFVAVLRVPCISLFRRRRGYFKRTVVEGIDVVVA